MNPKSQITIFTDGSSRGNPGPGGFGAVIVYNDDEYKVESQKFKVVELGGREEHTTNNRMELRAAIEALSYCSRYKLPTTNYQLFSDSSYVINGITKWVFGWRKNNWLTKEKKEVLNRDLWEKLFELTTIYRSIEWKQIGGHIGVAGNERCDEIAQAYAELTPADAEKRLHLYRGDLSKYPIKNILDISSSVVLEKSKHTDRSHSNAKAYSYVSKVNGEIKTHKTWGECEARVKGKSGTRYKKALSASDETTIIKEWSA